MPNPFVRCRVEWGLSDGTRIFNMEKYYDLPCWLQVGMELETDVMMCGQKVTSSHINLERCSQSVYLSAFQSNSAQLDELVADLTEDGWVVESEDYA